MLTYELAQSILLAGLLGALIGIQREHNSVHESKPRFAGIRTFILISLLGFISMQLSIAYLPSLFLVVTFGYILFVIVAYVIETRQSNDIGATTELASLMAFFVGAFCAKGHVYTPVFLAIVTTAILAFKEPLHQLASKLKHVEMLSTIKFAVLAFIILPLLPNEAYGPYEVFNPFMMMLMVVLITGISFCAYILIKVFGPKSGLGLTGLLGGMISSTAITTSLSTQSQKAKGQVNSFVLALVAANSIMFFRILFVVWIIDKTLISGILAPLLVMGIIGFLCALYLWKKGDEGRGQSQSSMQFESPFTLGPALKFAFFFTAVLFLTKGAQQMLGSEAIYAVSVLSGLLDVDAITVSIANLTLGASLDVPIAAFAIVLASIANTFFKAGIVLSLGNREVARKACAIFLFIVLCGVASFFFF